MSFDTWKLFSLALRRHRPEPDLFDFSCAINHPKSLLQVYTNPLRSNQCQFLTSLSISVDVSNSELAKLPELSNLIVLELACPVDSRNPYSVGDRQLRDWHSAALNDRAFPVLRFLRLWGFEEVSSRSLTYIDAFPALAVFDVTRCGITHKSPIPSGWTRIWGDNPSRVLANACSDRNEYLHKPKAKAYTYDQCSQTLSNESAELDSDLPGSDQPTLHAMLTQSDNQSGMRFIPRRDMPKFLSQPLQAARLRRDGLYDSDMKVDTWGKTTYRVSPLVGDIRHDADLAKAGFDIHDQPVIRTALINSVPLASVRLGPKYNISNTSSRISFIRSDVLYPLNIRKPTANDHSAVKDDARFTDFPSIYGDSYTRGVMDSKKRKLNDLLDSFL